MEKAEHLADAASTATSLLGILTYAGTGSTKAGALASNVEGIASFAGRLNEGSTTLAEDSEAGRDALGFATAVSPQIGGCH